MDNKLTPQLVLLCEAAGYSTLYVKTLDETLWAYDDDMPMKELPGASGQLASSEVGLVLSWLAKAGYEIRIVEVDQTYLRLFKQNEQFATVHVGADTLEQALTEAILQLKLGETV